MMVNVGAIHGEYENEKAGLRMICVSGALKLFGALYGVVDDSGRGTDECR